MDISSHPILEIEWSPTAYYPPTAQRWTTGRWWP